MARALLTLTLAGFIAGSAFASNMTQAQILQALDDMESCIRTMCLPANDPSMSLGYARNLKVALSQNPNALDNWVMQRLDPIITLLTAKQIAQALQKNQALVYGLIRPQLMKDLNGLEVCVRTMCLPGGNATMGIGEVEKIVKGLAKHPGAATQTVTQRLNAANLLLKQKKIKEGLEAIQALIRELPQA